MGVTQRYSRCPWRMSGEEVVHWLVKKGATSDGDKDQEVSHQDGNVTQ